MGKRGSQRKRSKSLLERGLHNYVLEGKLYVFTSAEMNRAWKRGKKLI